MPDIRCPFKIELVGVKFYCNLELGHRGRCEDRPPGGGGDVRITWEPSPQMIAEEIMKCVKELELG